MSSIHETTLQVKADSFSMAALPGDIRNKALQAIIDNLQSHRAAIFAENAEDLKRGEEAGLPQPIMKRLKFDEAKLADVCAGMEGLQHLPDPLFRTLLSRQLDEFDERTEALRAEADCFISSFTELLGEEGMRRLELLRA